jgi:hypothetical protein
MSENESDFSEKQRKLKMLFRNILKEYSAWWSEDKQLRTSPEYENKAFHHA